MGFGPSTSDPQSGAQAVIDLIDLLYPERSTPPVRRWLRAICEPLLASHAPLAFDTISRFLSQPDFRRDILEHDNVDRKWRQLWAPYQGSINPNQLDANLAWLIHDRLIAAAQSEGDKFEPPQKE